MAGAAIRIAVLANASQAKRELNGVAGTAEKVQGRFTKFRAPALLALGGIAVGAKKAVDAASDLNEETSKSEVIFGKQAGAIKSWAGTAATSMGQSKRQALEAASGFGIIGQKAGLSGTETEKFAKQFTGLSSDLASFNNTSPEEAITAISAAMRGESEPIRKYGVLLDDATLKARAMKLGLIKTTKQALTPQQKALAASKEILAQTGKAQGDFARTSDGAANKSRILAAQSEDLKAKLGTGLLPAYQGVLSIASKFAGAMAGHTGIVKGAVVVIAALAAIVLVAGAAQKVYTAGLLIYNGVQKAIWAATVLWRNAQLALNLAMMLNPVGLVVLAIVALIAIFAIAWAKSERFRAIVTGAWHAIKAASIAVFGFLKAFLTGTWRAIKGAVTASVRAIGRAISATWGAIKAASRATWNAIKAAVMLPVRLFVAYVKLEIRIVKTVVSAAWNFIKSATTRIWNGIKAAVRNAVSGLMTIVRGIKGKVTGVFSGAAGWLLSAGKHILQGLIDGIGAMIGKVKDKLGVVTKLIPSWKGPAEKDRNLLRPAGSLIIGGLVKGMDKETPKVKRFLAGLSDDISTFSATPEARVQLSAADAFASFDATRQITVTASLKLTSQQLSQLQRGREIKADLKAFEKAGGR